MSTLNVVIVYGNRIIVYVILLITMETNKHNVTLCSLVYELLPTSLQTPHSLSIWVLFSKMHLSQRSYQ